MAAAKCKTCGGWINPPWARGDGDYAHCTCSKVTERELIKKKYGKSYRTLLKNLKQSRKNHGK